MISRSQVATPPRIVSISLLVGLRVSSRYAALFGQAGSAGRLRRCVSSAACSVRESGGAHIARHPEAPGQGQRRSSPYPLVICRRSAAERAEFLSEIR